MAEKENPEVDEWARNGGSKGQAASEKLRSDLATAWKETADAPRMLWEGFEFHKKKIAVVDRLSRKNVVFPEVVFKKHILAEAVSRKPLISPSERFPMFKAPCGFPEALVRLCSGFE